MSALAPLSLRADRRFAAKRAPKRRAQATLALVTAAALILGTAAPASARTLNAWAWSEGVAQTFLFTEWGSGTYNKKIRIEHFLIDRSSMCGTQGKAWGKRSNGSGFSRTFGYYSGCGWVVGAATTYPKIYFKASSKLYGQFYRNGKWRAGSPSINV